MTRPIVLFACIHNSGRSAVAKVLTEHYVGNAIEVPSAGSEPGNGLNPTVAPVLGERGLTAQDHTPALLTFDGVQEVDIVITMGCGETCPVFPSKRYEDWRVDDPAGQDLPAVRRIVDDVDQRVRNLLAGLHMPSAGGCPALHDHAKDGTAFVELALRRESASGAMSRSLEASRADALT